jgi:hypothetical protein
MHNCNGDDRMAAGVDGGSMRTRRTTVPTGLVAVSGASVGEVPGDCEFKINDITDWYVQQSKYVRMLRLLSLPML